MRRLCGLFALCALSSSGCGPATGGGSTRAGSGGGSSIGGSAAGGSAGRAAGGSGGSATGGGGGSFDVCNPSSTSCKVPPGTPVWTDQDAVNFGETDADGDLFFQPKWGGDGIVGDSSTRIDGYSAVISLPGELAFLSTNAKNVATSWPGIDLEGGWFIQNGVYLSEDPCVGSLWVWIFKVDSTGGTDVYHQTTQYLPFCNGGPVQFKAQRNGNAWDFYYRAVGTGAGFTQQGHYDFGAVHRGLNPVFVRTELYDYAKAADKVAPVAFTSVLAKVNGTWQPVDRLQFSVDFASPYLFAKADPQHAGVTTSAPGAKCYAHGDLLWASDVPCFGVGANCDPVTGRCDP